MDCGFVTNILRAVIAEWLTVSLRSRDVVRVNTSASVYNVQRFEMFRRLRTALYTNLSLLHLYKYRVIKGTVNNTF